MTSSRPVSFASSGHELRGILQEPENDCKGIVLLLHPHPLYGGGLHDAVISSIAANLVSHNYSCFRFGFRGSSTTPKGYDGVNGAVLDSIAALHFIESTVKTPVIAYIGYSFGGSTALRLACSQLPNSLVTLSASFGLLQESGFDLTTLSGITCPVLMFHGDSDQMVPYSDMNSIASKIRSSPKRITLEGEGHFYRSSLDVVHSHLGDFLFEHKHV